MFRKLFALAVAVFFFAGSLMAGEVKGQLLKVDAENNTVTVLVGKTKTEKGEEKVFSIAKDARFIAVKGKKGETTEEALTDGLKNELFTKLSGKGGPGVTLTTEGDKEVVKTIKIRAGKKAK